MSLSLLSQAAKWLYEVNPTLCKVPPRANDEEYCYMGHGGDNIGALWCKDISYAMATCVGSWFLTPQHHIVEGIVVTIAAVLVLIWVTPKLFDSMDARSLIKVQHPPGSHLASLFCFGMIFIYKWFGYPRRIFYLVMPCNMQWVLSFFQCWIIPQSWTRTQYTVLQMRLTYIMSVVIAIVMPETDDCEMPGEYVFYWFNHVLLLWLPYAYMCNGSVSCFPPPPNNKTSDSQTTVTTTSTTTFNLHWWLFSCAVFAVFYFIPVTLMAIYSGLNLNFMLHPPQDHLFLRGQWYRLVTVLLLMVVFAVSRLLVMSVEKASPAGKTKTNNLAATNNNKSKLS
jgi:TMEM164 family